MYVTYFDEVKDDIPAGRAEYLVGGLVVPMESIGEIEEEVADLSEEIFNSRELKPETEFHGKYIYAAKGPFRGMSMAARTEIIAKLSAIVSRNDIKRVYACIDTAKLYNAAYAAEFAFAHFVERVQLAVGRSPCILIGDLDDEQVRQMVKEFSRYRRNGTPWRYGISLSTVVDSVHFCRSHHSRMIQLADMYLWLQTHRWGYRKSTMAVLVTEAIKEHNLFPARYKNWPP